MQKYLLNLELGFRRYQQYPLEFLFMSLKRIIQIIFMIVLWEIISQGESKGSITELLSYFVVFNAITDLIMVQSFNLGNRLAQFIHTGKLNNILIKPVNPTLYLYFKILGKLVPLILVSAIAVIVLIWMDYFVPGNFLIFLIYMLIGIIIGISLNSILASFAFYFTKIFGIREVFKFSMRIFSGSFIPIYFMPDTIQQILDLSFISYIGYKPVMIILGRTAASMEDILLGAAWAIIFMIMAKLFWNKAIAKYEAYGI